MFLFFFTFKLITSNFPDNFGVEYETSNLKTLLLTPSSLKEYTIPSSCTKIDGGELETSPFRPCRNNIKKITFEKNSQLKEISNYVFSTSTIETLDFGNCEHLETLPGHLCEKCSYLSTLILPPNIITIKEYAFRSCSKLININLPTSLSILENYAFQYAPLNTIEFTYDSQLTKMGYDCFSGCKSKSFFFGEKFENYAGAVFLNSNIENITIHENNKKFFFDGNALYSYSKDLLYFVTKSTKELILPDTVKTIYASAIRKTQVTSITFDGNITQISSYAIAQITTLETFDFPMGISEIASYCMTSCTSLHTVTIPKTVTKINKYAFSNCDKLKNIELHEGITTIDDHAFEGCSELVSLTFPSSLTDLGEAVFTGCSNLVVNNSLNTYVYIDKQMLFVDEKKQLNEYFGTNTSITIPSHCQIIGESAFVSTPVEEVYFEDSQYDLQIQNSTFSETKLRIIHLPERLISLGSKCFYHCINLKSIDISQTKIKTIPSYCFYNCSMLETFTFPLQLEKIESYGFAFCSSLNNFDFSKTNIKSIEDYAFYYASLKNQNIKFPNTLQYLEYSAFEGCQFPKLDLSSAAIETIPLLSFASNKALNEIQFNSNSIKTISDQAFENCISLLTFTLPTSIITLLTKAFYGCLNLYAVNFPENCCIEDIKGQVFGNCPKLTQINIPENDKKFNFKHSILYEYSITKVIMCLPSYTSQLYVVPSSVEIIQQYSFSGCKNIQQIFISDGTLTTIGFKAFLNCTKLNFIYLPSTISSIGLNSFSGCTSLKCGSVVIEDNNETIIQQLQTFGSIPTSVFSKFCPQKSNLCKCNNSYKTLQSMLFVFIALPSKY